MSTTVDQNDQGNAIALAPFKNRLRKNFKHLRKWAKRQDIGCFRVYDRDIPEFPLAVDIYEQRVHIQVFSRKGKTDEVLDEAALSAVVAEVLDIPVQQLSFKTRQRQQGLSQYEKQQITGQDFVVEEFGLKFLVNLDAYLDTGLFLDHRQTRQWVREHAAGRRVLNLFAYTGSFSVYAVAGGAASSVTVDLSNTYQNWSRKNFQLNGMDEQKHQLVAMDVFDYLKLHQNEKFDLIIMDPPSFSNSKKMQGILDVQRDHVALIEACLNMLSKTGELVFSNNLKKFKLDPAIERLARVEDISFNTIPEDFKRHRPHHCWRMGHPISK